MPAGPQAEEKSDIASKGSVASRLGVSLRRKRSANRSTGDPQIKRLCPMCKTMKEHWHFLTLSTGTTAMQCSECLDKSRSSCPLCKQPKTSAGPCPCSTATNSIDTHRKQWKCYLCKNRKDKSLFPPHFGSNHKCSECCEKTLAKEALRQKKRETVLPAPSAKRVKSEPSDSDLVLCPAPPGELCSFGACPFVPKEISAQSEVSVMDPQNRHYHPSCLLEVRKETRLELKFSSLQGYGVLSPAQKASLEGPHCSKCDKPGTLVTCPDCSAAYHKECDAFETTCSNCQATATAAAAAAAAAATAAAAAAAAAEAEAEAEAAVKLAAVATAPVRTTAIATAPATATATETEKEVSTEVKPPVGSLPSLTAALAAPPLAEKEPPADPPEAKKPRTIDEFEAFYGKVQSDYTALFSRQVATLVEEPGRWQVQSVNYDRYGLLRAPPPPPGPVAGKFLARPPKREVPLFRAPNYSQAPAIAVGHPAHPGLDISVSPHPQYKLPPTPRATAKPLQVFSGHDTILAKTWEEEKSLIIQQAMNRIRNPVPPQSPVITVHTRAAVPVSKFSVNPPPRSRPTAATGSRRILDGILNSTDESPVSTKPKLLQFEPRALLPQYRIPVPGSGSPQSQQGPPSGPGSLPPPPPGMPLPPFARQVKEYNEPPAPVTRTAPSLQNLMWSS